MTSKQDNLPPLRVFVAPVSGGALIAQIALMRELSLARSLFDPDPTNCVPHLALGSSGGNIANYIALAAAWDPYALVRVTSLLDPAMLTQSWWPQHLDFLPTGLIGIFSGSLYRQGYGATALFANLFTAKTITATELWTGVFNKTRNCAQMFCNKREGETYIQNTRCGVERVLFNCERLSYTNGNIELLAKIAVASASIPVLISDQYIHGSHYVDGGAMYASPLSLMTGELLRIVKGAPETSPTVLVVEDQTCVKYTKGDTETELKNITEILQPAPILPRSLQMVYFSCVDISYLDDGIDGGVGESINTLIEALSLLDRAKGVELLASLAKPGQELCYQHHRSLNTNSLSKLVEEASTYDHYYLNIYPHGRPSINMLSFTTSEIRELLTSVANAYGAQLWYLAK